MDHVFHELLLVVSLISWNEFVESLNTSTDSYIGSITLDRAVLLLGSNQVLVIFDVSNWDCNVAIIDGLTNS